MFKLSKYNHYLVKKDTTYIYNILFRSFLCFPNELWELVTAQHYDELIQDEIDLLLKYGIILYENIDEQLVFDDIIKSSLLSGKDIGIFISMTSGCNFACPYCYQDYRKDITDKKYITKINIDAIHNFISNNKPQHLSIVYFGGEPTLNEEILQYAIKKFDSIENTKVYHSVITNGYILSDNILELYKQIKSLSIQITLDGYKINHDMSRITEDGAPTFDTIYMNIKRLADTIPKQITVRVNVDLDLKTEYYHLIDLLCDDGLEKRVNIWFEPIFNGQKKKNCNENKEHMDVLDLVDYSRKKGFNLLSNVEYGPCIAHSKSSLAIDENLKTYICPGELYENAIGYLQSSGDHRVTKNDWYVQIYKRKECISSCKYGPICYGGCIMNNECRKLLIDELLPVVINQKIEKYEKQVSLC